MRTLLQDLRFGLRMLAKNPGFTLIAVLALALGIGANTALFSLINKVLLSPLPFHNTQELALLFSNRPDLGGAQMSVSGPDFLDWREQNHSFTDLATLRTNSKFNLTGYGEPVALKALEVSANFFEILDSPAHMGRYFTLEDGGGERGKVVVLGHALWKSRFGQDPAIIGKTVQLDEEPYTVVGVMTPEMGFMNELAEIIIPEPWDNMKKNRGNRSLVVLGRLKPGVTLEQAKADIDIIAKRLEEEYVENNKGVGATVMALHEDIVNDVKPIFLTLYGAVGFVLLISCVNVANLLMAKSNTRSKEIAIRFSMGASRLRVMTQLLIESTLLSVLSGVIGLLIGMWGIDLMIYLAPKLGGLSIPRFLDTQIDLTVLLFTLGLSVLTGLIFGLLPAWQTSKIHLSETLKESSRGATAGQRKNFLLSGLVSAEVALSLILLIGAGLMLQSFLRLLQADPGFHTKKILTVELELPQHKRFSENPQRVSFYHTVKQEIQAIPGVDSVGLVNILPMTNTNTANAFTVKGRPPLAPGEYNYYDYRLCSLEFFQVLGVPLLGGRLFDKNDEGSQKRIVIINQALVKKYFPNEEAIGQHLVIQNDELEIIGVVGNVRHGGLAQEDVSPTVYEPLQQACWHLMNLVIKSKTDPLLLVNPVRQAIWSVDPNLPISSLLTMQTVVNNSISLQRFSMILLCIFSALALLLASMGIYGVMAYSVSQRTHEIGVRMALGAKVGDILRLVLRHGMLLTAIGVGIGVAGSLALNQFLSAMLYQVKTTDLITFVLVSLLLCVVALLACYIPARRATKVNPMEALRYE